MPAPQRSDFVKREASFRCLEDMKNVLEGLRIAILVTDAFEQVEMTRPRQALEEAGASTELIAPIDGDEGQVEGFNHLERGDRFRVDLPLSKADPLNYDGLLLPGGVANPDRLRTIPEAVRFVQRCVSGRKPVAAICHGPWLLVEANMVRDRTLTSWPSLRTDIRNAGGEWLDREVVVDKELVTSRKPDDIPAFNRRMIEVFSQECHVPGHGARSSA